MIADAADRLLTRADVGERYSLSARSVSRLRHLVPPDLYLPGGRPRWRQSSIESALQRLARQRRPRPPREREPSGRFAAATTPVT